MIEEKTKTPFLKNLWKRRIPHILGIYLGSSWAIVEFVSSLLVDRYLLSPHLIDFTIIILLSLIPSVILLAYFHGKPGRDNWTRTELIGIPLNLLLTIILLVVIFNGKDLGATTKTVTLENEEGERIERVIPKSQFRKKISSFPFLNELSDSTYNWLQYGFEFAVDYDLCQDLFIQRSNIYQSNMLGEFPVLNEMKRYGFPQGIDIPLTLKNKIAQDNYMDYIFFGSFTVRADTFYVKTYLHETVSGKLIAEESFQSTDIFELADSISYRLKQDLEIPAHYLDAAKDLPVSEILTASVPAFKSYIKGFEQLFENNYTFALNLIENAANIDPSFAMAHLNMAGLYTLSNQTDRIDYALEKAMNNIYKLPEQYKFILKIQYYSTKNDFDSAIALSRMRIELYPEDLMSYRLLAIFLHSKNLTEEELQVYKSILKIDPTQYDYFKTIGKIYEEKGETDEALKYYKEYADIFPEVSDSYITIGDLYRNQGNYQEAKKNYEKASLLDPDKVEVILNLSNIEERTGNFDKAVELYEKSLGYCRTAQDSADVYSYLSGYYETRGQISKSIEYVQKELVEMEKFQNPFVVIFGKFALLTKYVMINRQELALETVEKIESELSPPYDQFSSVGYLKIYQLMEDKEELQESLQDVEQLIELFGLEMLRSAVFAAKGKLMELSDEYEQAIEMYQKELELDPADIEINRKIGICYRELEDFNKAEDHLLKVVNVYPYDPITHYEIALLYHQEGKQDKALEHMKIALDIWDNADPDYIYAQKAKAIFQNWDTAI